MIARLLVLASLGAALAAVPAAGDWLVTGAGKRIETRGPWEVKGRQVIFTLPNGRLSVLRLADVDLEASAAANQKMDDGEAVGPAGHAAADEAAEREPVLVLTNENIRSADADSDAEGAEDGVDEGDQAEEAEDAEEEPEGFPPESVQLISWRSHDNADGDGLEVVGTLRNTGEGIAAGIRVTVRVPGEEDLPPVNTRAFLEATALAPGKSTGFRALFPGIYSLTGDPSFEIESQGFSVQGPADSPPPSDEAEPGEVEDFEDEPPAR